MLELEAAGAGCCNESKIMDAAARSGLGACIKNRLGYNPELKLQGSYTH